MQIMPLFGLRLEDVLYAEITASTYDYNNCQNEGKEVVVVSGVLGQGYKPEMLSAFLADIDVDCSTMEEEPGLYGNIWFSSGRCLDIEGWDFAGWKLHTPEGVSEIVFYSHAEV
jgi:hypothetical protein